MKIRIDEDYYFWCCDWCDSENLVLWARLQDGPTCGACHRPLHLGDAAVAPLEGRISAGLC
jgi:hypothetical protein